MSETAIDVNTQVSHSQDGRTLSGVGVEAERLEAVMERHAPEPAKSALGTEAAPASDGQAAAPAQTRGRQRFSDLTRERDAARDETAKERTQRETLEREVTDLRAKLAQASTPQQAAQAQQQLTQAEQRQAQQPQRFAFPKYEEFIAQPGNESVDYDSYLDIKADARDQWRESQRPIQSVVQQALEADRSQRSFMDSVQQAHTKGRAAYKDFDAVLQSGPGASIPLSLDTQANLARLRYVVNHPQTEHIQYAIMKDAALAQALQAASDIDFGIRIASLVPAPQAQRQASAPSTSYVFDPVGSGSQTTTPKSSEVIKGTFDYDKSGYRERRAAERGLKSRAR